MEPHIEVECYMVCPSCNGNPYTIWRRQNVAQDGRPLDTYSNQIWPGKDATGNAPPADIRDMKCPNCRVTLKRSSAP